MSATNHVNPWLFMKFRNLFDVQIHSTREESLRDKFQQYPASFLISLNGTNIQVTVAFL